MRLVSFQIKNYKIIDETETVKVDRRLTTLIGKNESGKTAVLKALWKTSNVANATFDKLYDYPRNRYFVDRKGTQEVTVLEFELSSQETMELVAQIPQLTVTEQVRAFCTTLYHGEDGIRRDVRIEGLGAGATGAEAIKAIGDLTLEVADQSSDEHDALHASAVAAVDQIVENAGLWEQATVQALDSVEAEVAAWLDADPARLEVAVPERERLTETAARARQGDPLEAARAWVVENLPTFIYFESYGQLEARIHLPTYLERVSASDPRVRTQTALFEWSRLDPAEILALGQPADGADSADSAYRRREKRRTLLDAASFALTGDWIEWWTERRHKLHFDVEGEDLVLKVSDQNNEIPVPFDERSHGFQWFFSFCLVHLVETARAHKGAILLFDEPGLHLHPALQGRLLALFERVSDSNQIIYTTHLPFLVDSNHLERVRTVFLDGSKPQKGCVSNSVGPTGDRDTLFPVQAALGYSIAQSLFMGKRTVIVQELSDYWLIRTLNMVLPRLDGGVGLHNDIVLIPAGVASRLIPLASIMLDTIVGADARLVVLLDSAPVGDEVARRLNDVFAEEPSVLMLGAALGVAEATIEDLLPRHLYVSVAVGRDGYELSLDQDEQEAATNLHATQIVYRRLNRGMFGRADRMTAALTLTHALRDPEFVPEYTQKRAQALVNAINARFDNRS